MQYKVWVHFEVQSLRNNGTDSQQLIVHTAGWRVLTVEKLPECEADFAALQETVQDSLTKRDLMPSVGQVLIVNWQVIGHVVQEEELP